MHVYVGFFTTYLAAVAFQPKSGGRVWEATAFSARMPDGHLGSLMPELLDSLAAWPERTVDSDWQAVTGVWAPSVLYGAYSAFGRKPPWKESACRDPLTVYWLLGDPSIVDTGPITGPVKECVRCVCQLQNVLGRLQS